MPLKSATPMKLNNITKAGFKKIVPQNAVQKIL